MRILPPPPQPDPWSVKVNSAGRKPPPRKVGVQSRAARRTRAASLGPMGCAVLLAIGACSAPQSLRVVSVQQLEAAPSAARPAGRAVLCDARRIAPLLRWLGPRLALFEIHTAAQWDALRAAAPMLQGSPDFSRGIVVGVVSRAGIPLDGQWPIRIESVRVHDRAGYIAAAFVGGNYLADDTTFLEVAYVPNLESILMLDVNGVRYYP